MASWDGPSSMHRVGDAASGLNDEEGSLYIARGFLAQRTSTTVTDFGTDFGAVRN
jgi:hypothetical protein